MAALAAHIGTRPLPPTAQEAQAMNYESDGTDEETATKTTTKTATKTATKTTKKTATKKTKVGPLSCTSLLYVSAA
jgi:hypothetical protein